MNQKGSEGGIIHYLNHTRKYHTLKLVHLIFKHRKNIPNASLGGNHKTNEVTSQKRIQVPDESTPTLSEQTKSLAAYKYRIPPRSYFCLLAMLGLVMHKFLEFQLGDDVAI